MGKSCSYDKSYLSLPTQSLISLNRSLLYCGLLEQAKNYFTSFSLFLLWVLALLGGILNKWE